MPIGGMSVVGAELTHGRLEEDHSARAVQVMVWYGDAYHEDSVVEGYAPYGEGLEKHWNFGILRVKFLRNDPSSQHASACINIGHEPLGAQHRRRARSR